MSTVVRAQWRQAISEIKKSSEWVRDDEGQAVAWTAPHEELLFEALHSWKGWPTSMQIHMSDETMGAPQPSSGSGKQMRAQAAAILRELRERGRPIPDLWRGDHYVPRGWKAWSEVKAVAQGWQRRGGGKLWHLPAGTLKGIRIADFITSTVDQSEREWIVEVSSINQMVEAVYRKAAGLRADVASWGRLEPWRLSREEVDRGDVPGVVVGHAWGTEDASYLPDGRIALKESYFTRPPDVRRAILYHEAGHGLEAEVGLAGLSAYGVDDPLGIIEWPGARSLGGNVSEVLAEGYAALWTDPGWFGRSAARQVRDLVVAMARDRGYPLP